MKNNNFFFYLFFLGLILSPASVRSEEEPPVSPELQAQLLEYEVIAARAAEAKPRWRSSVGEIEKTAQTLMETNTKIASEFRRLSEQIKSTQEAIQAQKALGKSHGEALKQRKADIDAPQSVITTKTGLTDAQRSLAQKRMDLAALQAKQRGLDSRINLRQLKLSELSLQLKTLMVERRTREQMAGSALKAEIESLTGQVESQTEQEKMIREKLAVLQKENQPVIAEAFSVNAEIADLKQRLSEASAQQQSLTDQAASLEAKKASLENDKVVQRYRTLTGEKESLSTRIAKMEEQIGEMEKVKAVVPQKVEDLKAEQVTLEKQSKGYLSEMEDLRENIAILEYKISALERYQGRNRNLGR